MPTTTTSLIERGERLADLRRLSTARDITNRAQETIVRPPAVLRDTPRLRRETTRYFTIEDLGLGPQPPERTYAISIAAGLQGDDGQTLGYAWTGIVENWHDRAFASFGDGHGVWETGGGPLPFYARNFTDVRQWVQSIALRPPDADDPRPRGRATSGVAARRTRCSAGSASTPTRFSRTAWISERRWSRRHRARLGGDAAGAADCSRTHQVDGDRDADRVGRAGHQPGHHREGQSAEHAGFRDTTRHGRSRSAGPTCRSSRLDNSVAWSGRTNAQGVALAPAMPLAIETRAVEVRSSSSPPRKTATSRTSAATGTKASSRMTFGATYDLNEAQPLLRGTVFSDRGVYKPGEEVHFKAILRRDTPNGIRLHRSGTPLYVSVRDGRDKVVDERTSRITAWSCVGVGHAIPADGALGNYQVTVEPRQGCVAAADRQARRVEDPAMSHRGRKPSTAASWWRRTGGRSFASTPIWRATPHWPARQLKGVVTARYLFGAAMGNRPVAWSYTLSPVDQAPAAVTNRFPADRFAFVGCCEEGVRFGIAISWRRKAPGLARTVS